METTTPELRADLAELAAKLRPVLRRHGVVRAGVFGSVARGEAGPDSDLDLLVEYRAAPRMSLHDLVTLLEELEAQAGRKVEMVEYDMVRERLRQRILGEQVAVL